MKNVCGGVVGGVVGGVNGNKRRPFWLVNFTTLCNAIVQCHSRPLQFLIT